MIRRSVIAASLLALTLAVPSFAGPITDKVLDAAAVQALASGASIPFAVVKISRDFNDPAWRDQVIGDGIRQLVVDEFLGNRHFTNMEDNPEIRDAMRDLVANTWFGKDAPPVNFGAANDGAPQLLISARLTDFSKRRVSGFGFGFGGATTTITVTVALDFAVGGKTILTTAASGEAKTAQEAALFQIAGNNISFDATTVGAAVRAAVHDAAAQGLKEFGL